VGPESIAAGIGAFGNLIGGGMSASASKEAQKQAQRHQVLMRGTHYQATVKDMKKAGLNPMMLAMGSGLSQGMGAGVAPAGQLGEGIQKASGKAMEAVMAKAQLGQMHSATALNEEMARKAQQEAALLHTQIYTEGAKGWSAQMANEVERARLQLLIENLAKQGQLTDAQKAQIYADMGLNDSRKNAMDASAAASYAAAQLDRAGLPSARYKNSAVGILMDEVNRTAGTVSDFLPTPKQSTRETEMYRRSKGGYTRTRTTERE